MKQTVMFDLDGTLLPMDQTEFTEGYFALLAAYARGYGYDDRLLMPALWKATLAMVNNDGTMTNEERFWKVFHDLTGYGDAKNRGSFFAFTRPISTRRSPSRKKVTRRLILCSVFMKTEPI